MNINNYIKKLKGLVPGEMSKAEQAFVLNALELVLQIVGQHQAEIQDLKDEINRLKGEQGKPTIPGNTQKKESQDDSSPKASNSTEENRTDSGTAKSEGTTNHSSEKERKESKENKGKKGVKFTADIVVDKEDKIEITDTSILPTDAVFKGYTSSYYQTLEIVSKIIEVKRARYYSPSKGKTYTAALPAEYEQGSDYTEELKGHVVMLKSCFGMSIPQVGDFMRMHGIKICDATISNIFLSKGEESEQEQQAIHLTGLAIGLYNQTDTTGARVNGVNYHTHVFGNDYYTAYFTRPHKDRQTVLDLLRGETPRSYLLNQTTLGIYKYLKIPKRIIRQINPLLNQKTTDKVTFTKQLEQLIDQKDFLRHKEKLLEGAYLAHYQTEDCLNILVCDDAPQYKLLTMLIALCWVHIGRHFKKINPKIKHHQLLLETFLDDFWAYYKGLQEYQQQPDTILARTLNTDFDKLFSRITGFDLLDQRIAKTKAKKEELLVVLLHPYVPLHNNDAELAARKEVRYRDISFQTRNQKGTLAKDVFFTIIQTCKKLGVNAYDYILDRASRKNLMPSLVQIMVDKTATPVY